MCQKLTFCGACVCMRSVVRVMVRVAVSVYVWWCVSLCAW